MRGVRASLLAVVLLGGVADAQPTDVQRAEAGELFERGEKAQAQGRYRDAIASYERAFELAPHPNVLFNIAVCYEKLADWGKSADYYQRYLDQDSSAGDAAQVRDKIRDLRARAAPGPISPGDPGSSATDPLPLPATDTNVGQRYNPFVPPPTKPEAHWHAGVSYGVGFGDTPNERYLAHGGIRIARRLELDAIFGKFGKNDVALGGMARLLVSRGDYAQPFLHGAATFGYAKQDDSSDAATKVPLGLEAGAGVRLGKQGRLEVTAILRVIRGGFDETSTVVDSYINDAFAFAVDVGFAFDIPLTISAAR